MKKNFGLLIITPFLLLLVAATVKAANNPPNATNVQITPATPSYINDLKCNYTYSDSENDSEGATTFKWYKKIGYGLWSEETAYKQQLLAASALSYRGDADTISEKWYCEVTPLAQSGSPTGKPVQSAEVEITNNAPTARLTVNPVSATVGQPIALNATASTDIEDCPTGGEKCANLTYTWETETSTDKWQELAKGAKTTVSFSSAGTKKIRLVVKDSQNTETISDIASLSIGQEYTCDFSAFKPSYFLTSATGFNDELSHPEYSIHRNSSIELSNIGLKIGGVLYNAGVKAEIRDEEGKLKKGINNRSESFKTYNEPFDISFVDLAVDKTYTVKLSRKDCSKLSGTSEKDAYENNYVANEALPWVAVDTLTVTVVGEHVHFNCKDFIYKCDKSFSADTAAGLGGTIIANNTDLKITKFGSFTSVCVDGSPASGLKYVARAEVYNEKGDITGTYYNTVKDGDWGTDCFNTPADDSSITVPFSALSKDKYLVTISALTCTSTEEVGAHSWNAFYRAYYCGGGRLPWEFSADNKLVVNLLNKDDMKLEIEPIDNFKFYFAPHKDVIQKIRLDWRIKNSSTDKRHKIKVTAANAAGAANCPFGSCSAALALPLNLNTTGETWVAAEDIAVTLKDYLKLYGTEETTIKYQIEVNYDDGWGLDTIPPKSEKRTVTVTFVPPPPDVLLVREIIIKPGEKIYKTEEKFDVEVVLQNHSKSSFEVEAELQFFDEITGQQVTLTKTQATALKKKGRIGEKQELHLAFEGIALAEEPNLKEGKNYWVVAKLNTLGSIETIIINNEERALIAIIPETKETNVPEMPLAFLPIMALIVLFIVGRRDKESAE